MTSTSVGARLVSALIGQIAEPSGHGRRSLAVRRGEVEADVGALAVADGNDVCRIVSERDIVRALSADCDDADHLGAHAAADAEDDAQGG